MSRIATPASSLDRSRLQESLEHAYLRGRLGRRRFLQGAAARGRAPVAAAIRAASWAVASS